MEVSSDKEYIYSSSDLDRHEGQEIEALKAASRESIPTPLPGWMKILNGISS